MTTDGYDPFDEPTPQEIYDRGILSPGCFDQLFVGGGGGRGASPPFWSGGGGAGFTTHSTDLTQQLLSSPITAKQLLKIKEQLQTPEERQEMAWTDQEAASLAKEILQEERREGLREKVSAAVAHYRELLAGATCGSTFTFMKTNEKGEHYFYACVKNADVWYTTAQNPRTIDTDEKFIEWLIGLGAHESAYAELSAGAGHKELGPIDATATAEGDDA